ncbi:hypothetical protein [Streptococcus oricebi]|uniref:Uncharacterized protein n=1 Tax=Streptococcus oricebi TaxID=1547447 RepID=A0ABS5B1D0_9STRE|nr:hypothetical protein [Streptococcus oricebi]MBP2622565.1 hypothetical protein [Streptococcus oricebi]
MALNDQEVQEIQLEFLENIKQNKPSLTTETGKKYKVINSVNKVTQAIAVAPLNAEGQPDYSQTTIVVAGTQPVSDFSGNYANHLVSTANALGARNGMSAQYKDIRQFYDDTEKKIQPHQGQISNMSGFSQSAPPVAKIAAEEGVPKVTNFMDWGGVAATDLFDSPLGQVLTKAGAPVWGSTGAGETEITKKDRAYLKKHSTSYSDSENNTTIIDGFAGIIPYGQVREVEGSGHKASFVHLKGNGLDIDHYVKNNQFCSGMTEEQVRKIAKYKAEKAKETVWNKPDTWFDSTDPQTYIDEYKKTYGAFASVKDQLGTKLANSQVNITNLQTRLGYTNDSKTRIFLRKELVQEVANTASLQGQIYDLALQKEFSDAYIQMTALISQLRTEAFGLANFLSVAEVEELLAPLSIDKVWSTGNEATSLAAMATTKSQLETFSTNINQAANRLEEVDKANALIFE